MKNRATVLLSAAVILGAGGMIFGNHLLASGAFAASGIPEAAIIMPEGLQASAMQSADVGMYRDADGAIYIASANGIEKVEKQEEPQTAPIANSAETYQNPINGRLSEAAVKQMGINAITENYALSQKDVDAFSVEVIGFHDFSETITWNVTLRPVNQEDYPTVGHYAAIIDDKSAEVEMVYVSEPYPDEISSESEAGRSSTTTDDESFIKEGTPLANEIPSEKAQELAIAAIVQKYALTQKTLDKFTVTQRYFEVFPEMSGKHIWQVVLNPTNINEFSEIGSYWTYLDAETGEILQLNSAANGKG